MDALQILREFGLPTVFLLVITYALWQASQWIAAKVIVPLQDRHFAFLEHLQQHLDTMAVTQSQLVTDLRKLSETVEALENRMANWESRR